MRRAVLTLSGTVAGLAALFSFRTHVPGISDVATPSTPTGLSASAPEVSASSEASPTLKPPTSTPSKSSASNSPGAKASTAPTMTQTTTAPAKTTPSSVAASSTPTKKASSPATTTPTAAPSTSAAAPSGSYAGPTEDTQYGEVQVTVTVSNGKITNAVGSLPDGGDSIAANAVSQLDSEVVSDQSANVQAVSGATYTSDGYIASLQSAVDQAGL
jgi:uncharacterized protein with FMN-binding domain